ncbi:hypothetical protein ACFL6D_02065 [Spirochaetota bacterium]
MQKQIMIGNNEKKYLRELAKKYMEYANLPVMEERKRLWYKHNALKGERPLVLIDYNGFENELIEKPICKNPFTTEIERALSLAILKKELIDDDTVISPFYTVNLEIDKMDFGLDFQIEEGIDAEGRKFGYKIEHPIKDLKKDRELIGNSSYSVDREYTLKKKSIIEEIFGDIMPVAIANRSLEWEFGPSHKLVKLMGMEQLMYELVDSKEEVIELLDFVVKDFFDYLNWQQEKGLLTLNNENHYAGSGSYGFTHELPKEKSPSINDDESGRHYEKVSPVDLWLNTNSQETVGISPEMYRDIFYPSYKRIAQKFGLVYYGCCEPVSAVWDACLHDLPHLRKVSISPWCDEEMMGERLRRSDVIYCRKPHPNLLSGEHFDEEAFTEHIQHTLSAAEGCELEISFRDIYTVCGDRERMGKAVKIIRNLIDSYSSKHYQQPVLTS